MNRWFHAVAAGLVLAMAACSDRPATITGAGATFPFPLYARWAEAYYGETQIRINYQPIGSSGGIRQIRTKTVDFGATDAPLTGENLRKEGLVQFPVVIGGIVPVYNIEGVPAGQLKLRGEVLADIFNARITRWNDARIIEINQGVTLPDAAITPVYRSDGSGTTDVFTTYLSGSVANPAQGRESSRCIVPPSCGEQMKLLGERQLPTAGIFRLLFTHHVDQLDAT